MCVTSLFIFSFFFFQSTLSGNSPALLGNGYYGFGFTGQGVNIDAGGAMECLPTDQIKAQSVFWGIGSGPVYNTTFAIDPVYFQTVNSNTVMTPIFPIGADGWGSILELNIEDDWWYILYERSSAIIEGGTETGCWTCVRQMFPEQPPFNRPSDYFLRCNIKQVEGTNFTIDDCQPKNEALRTDPVGVLGPTTDLCPAGYDPTEYVLAETEVYGLPPDPFDDGSSGSHVVTSGLLLVVVAFLIPFLNN